MLKISEAVIVEGKYDKIKLSNILDALIIETDGFAVFNDKERLRFIKKLADERGIIVITDSDHSGFQIRGFLSSVIDKSKIKHIYIPDVYGKEKRKKEPSKEGKLGVEGIDDSVLLSLFEKAGVTVRRSDGRELVTPYDFYACKISGTPDAKANKKKLLKALDLPEFLSSSALLNVVNASMTKEEFESLCADLFAR